MRGSPGTEVYRTFCFRPAPLDPRPRLFPTANKWFQGTVLPGHSQNVHGTGAACNGILPLSTPELTPFSSTFAAFLNVRSCSSAKDTSAEKRVNSTRLRAHLQPAVRGESPIRRQPFRLRNQPNLRLTGGASDGERATRTDGWIMAGPCDVLPHSNQFNHHHK